MIAHVTINNEVRKVDFSQPIDISIAVGINNDPPIAWYLDPLKIVPVQTDQFTGSVKAGGSVNFNNIFFNPHGHCTHTESVGHITPELISVNETLKTFYFHSKLITVEPLLVETNKEEYLKKGDQLLTKDQIKSKIKDAKIEALVIRTLPNLSDKLHKKYSSTNWPFLSPEAAEYIASIGIKHLLIDLPSVDREEDGGNLLAHRAFWNYPNKTRMDATITELIFVPDSIEDGEYLLNLQIASFINDANPSKPVLYKYFESSK